MTYCGLNLRLIKWLWNAAHVMIGGYIWSKNGLRCLSVCISNGLNVPWNFAKHILVAHWHLEGCNKAMIDPFFHFSWSSQYVNFIFMNNTLISTILDCKWKYRPPYTSSFFFLKHNKTHVHTCSTSPKLILVQFIFWRNIF